MNGISEKQAALIVIAIVVMIIFGASVSNLVESMDADELMVIQSPVAGDLTWHMTPGVKWQGFGKVTKYKKRDQFWFSAKGDQGKTGDQALKVRFNDGAHATISGSLSWELPIDEKKLQAIHAKYGSHDAVEQQLVRTVVEKTVYMTGPLMSSKESYAEKRNEILTLIEDQIQNGVFRTETIQEDRTDPVTLLKKTVNIVRIVKDYKGNIVRSDASPLAEFNIRTYNLSINEIGYEAVVETQIQEQQKAIMQVQLAVAKAQEAEQAAKTSAKEGEADAMKAKWKQEVIKTTAVTEANQKREVAEIEAKQKKEVAETEARQKLNVAELDAKSAEQFKIAETLRGEGEGARRKKVMEADGALEKKLDAFVKINKEYAEALKDHKGNWVPTIMMSGSSSNQTGSNGALDLINLLMVKTAKDLNLDLATSTKKPTEAPAPVVAK